MRVALTPAVLLFLVPLAGAEPAPPCDLAALFRAGAPVLDATDIAYLGGPDAARLAWGTSQVLMGLLFFYEATGERADLDRFLLLSDAVMANRADRLGIADDIRGGLFPGWSTGRYSGGKATSHLVLDGMIAFPLARLARMVGERPELADVARKAEAYTQAIEQTVAAYDVDWRDGPYAGEGGYYEHNTDMFTSLNRHHAMGRVLLELYLATDAPAYRDKVVRMATYFKRRLTWRPDGSVDWGHFMPDPLGRPPYDEDISHAGASVDFAALCAEAGLVFTREDVLGFAKTFRETVMLPDGRFASTVSGAIWDKRWPMATALRWGRILQVDPRPLDWLARLACATWGDTWPASKPRFIGPALPYLILARQAEAR